MEIKDFTKYETARILGARALQIAMNAPLLMKITPEDLEKIKFDALKIAEIELNSNILPISIKKPLPRRKQEKLKRAKEIQLSEKRKKEIEEREKEEISKGGEIMAIANPDDEQEEKVSEEKLETE